MDTLNIDNETKIENENNENNGNIKNDLNTKILIKKLPLKKLIERIDSKEIYIDNAPPTSPSRSKFDKFEKTKRKVANSSKFGVLLNSQKQLKTSLFNEESKSDDEENIKDIKLVIKEEQEGRKSIYTKYDDNLAIMLCDDPNSMFDIFDNTSDIKKLEEIWKYEKILLDYNIIDFTSKYKNNFILINEF